MAIARVNTATNGDFSGTSSSSLTGGSQNVTAGNTVVVSSRWYQPSNPSITSVTDTAGNTYSEVSGRINIGDGTYLTFWYCTNVLGNASNVITLALSGTVAYWAVNSAQYSGLATSSVLDAAPAGNNNGSGTSVTSASFSTDTANELIVATGCTNSGGAWSASGAVTGVYIEDATAVLCIADQIVSATQSGVTATLSTGSSNLKAIQVGTFRIAAASATPRARRTTIGQAVKRASYF